MCRFSRSMREHHFDLTSVHLTADAVASFDLVLVATDHAKFDYALILEHAQLIVDTRGVYLDASDKVVKA